MSDSLSTSGTTATTGTLSLLPLGGVGEIGMNGLLLGWGGRRWLIDCGVMFPDASVASTDVVLPDLRWFERKGDGAGDSLAGIVLTHAHEDHIGALPFVLARRRVPVYGARFTLELVERRLEEYGLAGRVELRLLETASRGGGAVRPPETPELAFSLLRVTHSIPEAASLVVETPIGTVLHTGDFKIDDDPMDGEHFDRDGFRALGDRGVLLMLSDSTNAQVPGRTASERSVVAELEKRVAAWPGRVVVAQFASNLHRLRGLEEVAQRTGRRLCLMGRSFAKYNAAARAAGIACLDERRLIDPDRVGGVPPRDVIAVLTGSQGERRAALYKASVGELSGLRIGPEDLVLLSSRVIPGNERAVYRIVNDLVRQGATVVHSGAAPIHTSGHARRDELREMLALVRPRMFIPVHGEYAFLKDHEALARCAGVETTLVMENGEEILVEPLAGLTRLRSVPLDPHYFDGTVTADAEELGLDERTRMFHNGCIAAHISLRRARPALVATVELQARGVFTDDGHHLDRAATEVADAIAELPLNAPDLELEEVARTVIRRYFRKSTGKKPVVIAFVTAATATPDAAAASSRSAP